MSWVSQCGKCARREACERGEVKPTVVTDEGEGVECVDFEPMNEVQNDR